MTDQTPRLSVLTYGDPGPRRVVFCHGLFGQGRNWSTLGRALAQEGWYVALPDLPDHGRSPWTSRVDYAGMADAVSTELDRLAPGPWSVVGHSMGGKVAMRLALDHREQIERLCVVDISPVVREALREFAVYVDALRAIDLASLSGRDAADAVLVDHGVDRASVRAFLLQNLRRVSTPADHQPPWRWQMNLALLGDQLDRLGGWPPVDPATQPYPGPVLWIAGAESDYVRTEYAPAMRALFPQTRLVTIKHAGHWVHTEQPEVFAGVLRRFLDP